VTEKFGTAGWPTFGFDFTNPGADGTFPDLRLRSHSSKISPRYVTPITAATIHPCHAYFGFVSKKPARIRWLPQRSRSLFFDIFAASASPKGHG